MNRFLLFGIVSIAIGVSGCSSGASTSNNGSANTAGTGDTVSSSTVPDPGNSNIQPQTAATVPVGPEVATPDSMLAGKKKLVDANPNAPIPEPQRNPGPENSEIATTMDKQGNFIELRWFNGDPIIVKAERTIFGPGKATIKIWLKNGKELTVSGDKVDSLATVQKDTLLVLAGVKRQPSAADTGAK